jgi:GNAT superfamily N-acetyltransferase
MDVIRSKGEIKQFVNNLAITFDRRSAGGGPSTQRSDAFEPAKRRLCLISQCFDLPGEDQSGYDLWYETLDRVGGAHHLVLLRALDGSVAGLSEAGWDIRTPSIVRQQLTAVARPWRGHGVGVRFMRRTPKRR